MEVLAFCVDNVLTLDSTVQAAIDYINGHKG
jgi:hypothetical protein